MSVKIITAILLLFVLSIPALAADTPEMPKADTPDMPKADTPEMPKVDTPEDGLASGKWRAFTHYAALFSNSTGLRYPSVECRLSGL